MTSATGKAAAIRMALDMLSRFIETIATWKRLVAEVPDAETSALPEFNRESLMQV